MIMAKENALTLPQSNNWINRFTQILPGVLLLFVIGYAGKLTETFIKSYGKAHNLVLPNIEYVKGPVPGTKVGQVELSGRPPKQYK